MIDASITAMSSPRRRMLVRTLIASVLALNVAISAIADTTDTLERDFADPPQAARPRVWWHWMNGNVTRDGIAKDFAWMKRVGLGGLQNFDANLGTPQVVDKRLVYMTPEWKDAFRYAAGLARDSGLELAIAASPGWSETGGPWVKPQDAMKKLVWSETIVPGGRHLSVKLTAPPAATGPYQSIAMVDPLASLGEGAHGPPPKFYADVAVLALPLPDTDLFAPPEATSGTGTTLDSGALIDSSLETAVALDRGTAEAPAFVMLTYDAPRTVRSITFYIPGARTPFADPESLPVLEAREGGGWRRIVDLPLTEVPTTASFAAVKAREFRVVLNPNTAAKRVGLGENAPGAIVMDIFPSADPRAAVKIAELRLGAEPRIDRFEAKAGFTIARDYYALSPGVDTDAAGIAPDRVIDLTSLVKPDGTLEWTPPAGRWRVLRLGYSLTGTTNHPATPEATGLEVDKYDRDAVRRYLETYLGMYRDTVGDELIGRQGLRALLTDSIEVGPSNWTPGLIERFKTLRGYDPRPWLPALTGTIVGSRAQSDAFLYDFRRTLADLVASEHYATVAQVAHEHGLVVYGEALEDVRPTLGDDMQMRAHADVPMAALWAFNRDASPRPTLLGDMKGASSVAHIYGQNLVAAESLTAAFSPWAFAPADLRRMVDLEFAYGINRPVIHTSVHQPVDDKLPGLSLAIFGQYFNRHETWAEMARPWVDYIARSSFLLQQGRNFADVAYFYGEESPITALYATAPLADVPRRYAYDFVNADVVLNRLSVEQGALAIANGPRYRVLYLGGTSDRMTLPVLRRIASLAEAGGTIVGDAPQRSPSLKDDASEFDTLVHRLWSGAPVTTVGSGRIIAGRNVEAALASMGVAPDFSYATPQTDSEVLFVHRRLDDGDIYFVNNRRNRAESIEARFRTTGRQPELWHADTGRVEPASYRIEGSDTVVPLDVTAEDSVFVVFRKPVTAPSRTVATSVQTPVAELNDDWNVAFEPGRGAPASAKLDTLRSLSANDDAGVRYFSGTATYTRSFALPKGAKPGAPLLLDLGQVGDVAQVRVNGKPVGIAWKPPYRLDIGPAVKTGSNQLEVSVANLWVNRLIGDAQPNAEPKITWTAMPTYAPDAPLRPSGLIGPIQLLGVHAP